MTNGALDKEINKFQNSIDGKIDRFEGRWVVVLIAGNQKLLWPIDHFPDNLKEGDEVKLYITTNGHETTDREIIAKKILNDILKHEWSRREKRRGPLFWK